MKKQKIVYNYHIYQGKPLRAEREVAYAIKLSSRLLLDALCYKWNKDTLQSAINLSIDTGNKEAFLKLSEQYRQYNESVSNIISKE